jgi:hypothetical protein
LVVGDLIGATRLCTDFFYITDMAYRLVRAENLVVGNVYQAQGTTGHGEKFRTDAIYTGSPGNGTYLFRWVQDPAKGMHIRPDKWQGAGFGGLFEMDDGGKVTLHKPTNTTRKNKQPKNKQPKNKPKMSARACGGRKILNPATGRCVDPDGRVGRAITGRAAAIATKRTNRGCPGRKILNPATRRCVDPDGRVGRAIMRASVSQR